MSTSTPPHQPRRPHIRCLPQDAAAIARLLHHIAVERELPGSAADRYLDGLIRKPWGVEFRVYDDALIDVWMLHLKPATRTSSHCHPRKDTLLLCLSGSGYLTDGAANVTPIEPGDVLHIEQGAAHQSTATTGMTLIEVETPRDKYDLVRLLDDAGRAGRGYERIWERHRVPIQRVLGGPARARLRPRCARRHHIFALETGVSVRDRPAGLAFAISLDPLGVLRRDIAICGRDDIGAIEAEQTYLTIRSTYQEDSP